MTWHKRVPANRLDRLVLSSGSRCECSSRSKPAMDQRRSFSADEFAAFKKRYLRGTACRGRRLNQHVIGARRPFGRRWPGGGDSACRTFRPGCSKVKCVITILGSWTWLYGRILRPSRITSEATSTCSLEGRFSSSSPTRTWGVVRNEAPSTTQNTAPMDAGAKGSQAKTIHPIFWGRRLLIVPVTKGRRPLQAILMNRAKGSQWPLGRQAILTSIQPACNHLPKGVRILPAKSPHLTAMPADFDQFLTPEICCIYGDGPGRIAMPVQIRPRPGTSIMPHNRPASSCKRIAEWAISKSPIRGG